MIYLLISVFMTFVASIASQSYQSNKYPADLHPSLCPHYPYCDNTVLAGFANGVAAFHSASAPGYPASLSPHACPNYPYCSHQIPPEAIHYRRSVPTHNYGAASVPAAQYVHPVSVGVASPAKYPSGVDPASCPNYPYCY